MTRPLSELFEQARSLQDELVGFEVTADQVRKTLEKWWPEWSDEDRADLIYVASQIAWAEAQAVEYASREFVTQNFVVARALGKFGRRRKDKIERVAEAGRRAKFFGMMTAGVATVEEPRRGPGRRHLPSLGLTFDPDQE